MSEPTFEGNVGNIKALLTLATGLDIETRQEIIERLNYMVRIEQERQGGGV